MKTMDEMQRSPAHDAEETTAATSLLCEGMAFVSENLEAFGLVSDAYPAATGRWLIAANGYEMADGVAPLTYPNAGGVDGLYADIYHHLLTPDSTVTDLLSHTFGQETDRKEHPVSRYAAALSVCTALHVLSDTAENASGEEIQNRLCWKLPEALAALRDRVCHDRPAARDDKLYTVSMAVSRMNRAEDGTYVLDLFTAGDYRFFLLDSDGLRPIPLSHSTGLSPDGDGSGMTGKRIRLAHPTPFAILLLSGSACEINPAEQQSLQVDPGLLWRYRMRMEAYILRVLTSCNTENAFGERAGRFFMGRANGRESASGAMATFLGDTPFPVFRADCLSRLRHLEDMIALLPDGYNPDTVPKLPSRTETEITYIRRLLAQEAGLSDRTSDALYDLAVERLNADTPAEPCPPPEDVPDYVRLSMADITETFEHYDAENGEDYAAIRQNIAALREQLSDHWITLRPILLAVGEGTLPPTEEPTAPLPEEPLPPTAEDDPDTLSSAEFEEAPSAETMAAASAVSSHRKACDRSYEAILRLNARLGELLEQRDRCRTAIATLLERQSAFLRAQGMDILHARGGADQAAAWADAAADEIRTCLREYANTYEATESAYRSVLSAYMAERERLFSRDAERASGEFSAAWQAMREGRMPDDQWNAYREAIRAAVGEGAYLGLWDDLRVISEGTGARHARIRNRATELRMARDIASRQEFRIAALRGAAYQDPDWGTSVCELLDESHRGNYFTMVRRWQETKEHMARRAAAYEEYRALYENENSCLS